MGYRSWYGLVMSGSYTTPPGQTYRLTVEDAPAEADVDVLPHALEAYNEADGRSTHLGGRSPFSFETTRGLSPRG